MVEQPYTSDQLATALSQISSVLLSRETLQSALDLVAAVAHQAVPGAFGAGVTLVEEGRKVSAASSSAEVARADQEQYDVDQGPCLDSWRLQQVVRMDDATEEDRWPKWTTAALAAGLRSSLSAPLNAGGESLGAMKIYSHEARAFDSGVESLLVRFADHAAVLVANKQSVERAEQLTDSLRDALSTRDLIATAKGIVMAHRQVDEESAFALLASASQRTNTKVRDVARAIVESLGKRGA